MKYPKLQMFLRLLTCALMMIAVAIQQSGRIGGHDLMEQTENKEVQTAVAEEAAVMEGTPDAYVVSTATLATDVIGFNGTTPLKITVTDGKISDIEPLDNDETPGFFNRVKEQLLPKYIGMTPQEVINGGVDAVSGATFSSRAVIENMQRGMQYALDNKIEAAQTVDWSEILSVKFIAALVVVLMGALLPLFVKNQRYRMVQLLLNVVVLGFWSGSFLSYSLMVNFLSNGMNVALSIIPIILLITAFIYPYFGKKGHYCAWQCPLGSIQELAGKSVKYKLKISPKVLKWLNWFHDGLWAALMLVMWCGVWFDWMNYELFSAFLFNQAAWGVIVAALLFVALSFVVQRPYCRFVCPTGSLFRIAQNSK
jgi:uncharacterized protein with FMN-binding domain